MVTQVYKDPDIYKIDVPLPENPLRVLNSYVIKTSGESLLIDTGFNQPECLEALEEGMRELNLDPSSLSLFLTHCHSDHIGLVNHISNENTRIYMSEKEYRYLQTFYDGGNHWKNMEKRMLSEGLSPELINRQRTVNPARAYAPKDPFTILPIKDQERIRFGDYQIQFIATPGHTPSHMCLYLPDKGILFSGDHILFDITPNITYWTGVEDSLGDYLDSLEKISRLDLQLVLPGHRGNTPDAYGRIRQIREHHRRRLEQTMDAISADPGLNAEQIGARLTWKMRGKSWEEFPIQQKWFALGETIAHLDYLEKRGQIHRDKNGEGIFVYTRM